MKHTTLLCSLLVLVLAATASWAAMPISDTTPLGGTEVGVGARAAAMGGAGVAGTYDGGAMYYNPAGLTQEQGLRWSSGLVGRVDGIDVLEDAQDVYDIITSDDINEDDFEFIRGEAQRLEDSPVPAKASVLGALAFDNFAVGGYALGGALIEFGYEEGTPILPPSFGPTQVNDGETVSATGNALWQYSWGLSVATKLNQRWSVGATLRQMEVNFDSYSWQAEVVVDDGVDYVVTEDDGPTVSDENFTADIGVLYEAHPQVNFGAIVRNVTSPEFDLDFGEGVITLEAEPQIDVGIAGHSEDGRHTILFDFQNLTSENGGSTTAHLGYEWMASRNFALRLGASNFGWTGGVGLMLGGAEFQLALGEAIDKQAGLGFNWDF